MVPGKGDHTSLPVRVGYHECLPVSLINKTSARHGLSYTTFSFSDLKLSPGSSQGTQISLNVSVKVKNEGRVPGSEVVQLYVSLPEIGLTTPRLQLRGFTKAKNIAPGTSRTVTIGLDKYAVSYWDATRNVWKAKAGKYGVSIGRSSRDLVLQGEFELEEDFVWVGL